MLLLVIWMMNAKKLQCNDPLNNYKIILCLFFTQLSISQVHSPIQALHKA